jgi:hypothetical protein
MKPTLTTIVAVLGIATTACSEKPFFDTSCAQSMTSDTWVAGDNEVVGMNYIASCKAHQGRQVQVGHRVLEDNTSAAFIIYQSRDLSEIKAITLLDYKNDGKVDTITVEEKNNNKETVFVYYKGPEYMRDSFEHATCTGLSEYLGLNTRNVCAESVSEYNIRQVAAREMKADDNFEIAETEVGVVLNNCHEIPLLYPNAEPKPHTTIDSWFNAADNLYAGLKALPHDDPNNVGQQEPAFTQRYSADIATLLSITEPVIQYEE